MGGVSLYVLTLTELQSKLLAEMTLENPGPHVPPCCQVRLIGARGTHVDHRPTLQIAWSGIES
jgi:hypothetical protein